MNNKITIYELLGKIKDGQAPAKIKYKNKIYEFKNYGCETGYVNEYGYEKHWFTNCFDIDDKYALNNEVEILDNEDEEKKIPEKLENEKEFYAYTKYEENKYKIDKVLYILKAINLAEEKIDNLNNSINSIIDYLKSKGE